jgi:TM2 domain-containing membrane protein YozV
MERKARMRQFALPALGLILTISGFSRLVGNENIRAIQMIYLIMIGVFIGTLLRNVLAHFTFRPSEVHGDHGQKARQRLFSRPLPGL